VLLAEGCFKRGLGTIRVSRIDEYLLHAGTASYCKFPTTGDGKEFDPTLRAAFARLLNNAQRNLGDVWHFFCRLYYGNCRIDNGGMAGSDLATTFMIGQFKVSRPIYKCTVKQRK